MQLLIHRGSDQIGGSCVEISAGGSRVIIDIGIPLVGRDKKQKFDLAKYRDLTGPELVWEGVLPQVPGLYGWDKSPPSPDGLLISHAHADHYGFLSYIRPEVPVWLGKPTHELIEISRVFTPSAVRTPIATPRHFSSEKSFGVGALKVTPYIMDHSAFDAHAFALEAGGKTVIYSGDFRGHGRKWKVFYRFLHTAPKGADALLLEGSMFARKHDITPTESELENKIVEVLRGTAGPALAFVSSQNIDRLVTLFRACRRAGRLFVIDFYTANALANLAKYAKLPHPGRGFPDVRVCFPYFLCERMKRQNTMDLMYRFKDFKIAREEISKGRDRVMLLVRPSMLRDLNAIDRLEKIEGGAFIYSLWGGYMEEPSTQKLVHFARSRGMALHELHTSGHANLRTLKKVVVALQPKRIVPIHTFCPDEYEAEFGDAVCRLKDGQTLAL